MIAAVILAAGSSTRLGRPKQRIELHGETLLARAVRIATEAQLAPVITVILDATLIDELQGRGAFPLLNRKAHEGMASSIVCGIEAAQTMKASGAVLLACDQPTLRAAHIRALVDHPEARCGSAYAGRIGIPAYFPAADFPALLALRGDQGARALLQTAASIPDESLALDIDTEADLAQALSL